MSSLSLEYDRDFYANGREGCQTSARVISRILCEHYKPTTVIDVGCGEGWFGKAFEELGCDVLGLEGEHASPVIEWDVVDLEQPFEAHADLAVCLEVAEHLSPKRAGTFIEDLCELAPVVLFSAAIPNQGGTHHVNEQWPDYWVSRFEANGYRCSGALRFAIWADERVEPWYRQNLIVATDAPERLPDLFDTPLAPAWPLVHPEIFRIRA